MNLESYDNKNFSRGAPALVEALWLAVSGLLVETWLPGSYWRITILKLFGANIGGAVVLKPGIKIKFPWRLQLGSHVWIGERVWIDNLELVSIGDNTCISQGAFICTGSHDFKSPGFDLITEKIVIGSRVWVGAYSRIFVGANIPDDIFLKAGSTVIKEFKISDKAV